MTVSIVTQSVESNPIFFPTEETNRRQARCLDCSRVLPKGAGRKWDWSPFAYQYTYNLHPRYLCRSCSEHRQALIEIEPEVKAALAEIEAWAMDNVTLNMGWHTIGKIESLVRHCDLAAAEVAREIADRLHLLEDTSYPAVIGLARKVIREHVQGDSL